MKRFLMSTAAIAMVTAFASQSLAQGFGRGTPHGTYGKPYSGHGPAPTCHDRSPAQHYPPAHQMSHRHCQPPVWQHDQYGPPASRHCQPCRTIPTDPCRTKPYPTKPYPPQPLPRKPAPTPIPDEPPLEGDEVETGEDGPVGEVEDSEGVGEEVGDAEEAAEVEGAPEGEDEDAAPQLRGLRRGASQSKPAKTKPAQTKPVQAKPAQTKPVKSKSGGRITRQTQALKRLRQSAGR